MAAWEKVAVREPEFEHRAVGKKYTARIGVDRSGLYAVFLLMGETTLFHAYHLASVEEAKAVVQAVIDARGLE